MCGGLAATAAAVGPTNFILRDSSARPSYWPRLQCRFLHPCGRPSPRDELPHGFPLHTSTRNPLQGKPFLAYLPYCNESTIWPRTPYIGAFPAVSRCSVRSGCPSSANDSGRAFFRRGPRRGRGVLVCAVRASGGWSGMVGMVGMVLSATHEGGSSLSILYGAGSMPIMPTMPSGDVGHRWRRIDIIFRRRSARRSATSHTDQW
jgi:hypothetical protein